jgi:hypothetical protein
VHQRIWFGFVHGAHRFSDVLSGLGQRCLRHDPNVLAPAGTSEVPEIGFADQRLLDEDADLTVAAFRE